MSFLQLLYGLFPIAFIHWATDADSNHIHSYLHHHDASLVILSYLISVFGSFVSLRFVDRSFAYHHRHSRILWLLMAAIVMGGCAIWAMHFIAMSAFDIGIEIEYDLVLTFFSMILAIVVTGIGLLIIGMARTSWAVLIITGIFMGIGIVSMHYTGMAAMVMEADLSYRPRPFILSVLIAIVASITALWFCLNGQGAWQRYFSAIIMGVAISGMHYVGMFAAVFTPNPKITPLMDGAFIQPADFVLYIFLAILVTMSMILFASLKEPEDEEKEENRESDNNQLIK